MTELHDAAYCNDPDEVRNQLRLGDTADAVDAAGFSALMRACGGNNVAIFEQLVADGADIGIRSAAGTTAMHVAARCNFTEAIERLLNLRAEPRALDRWRQTPWQITQSCGFEESASLLHPLGAQDEA